MNRRELFKGIGASFLGGVAAKMGVEATRTITFMDYSAGSSTECDVIFNHRKFATSIKMSPELLARDNAGEWHECSWGLDGFYVQK